MLMQRRTRLELVMKKQREVKCEKVMKLGGFPLNSSKCDLTFSIAMTIMTKEMLLMMLIMVTFLMTGYSEVELFI